MVDSDKEAIEKIIEEAYIKGIHGNQDKSEIKGGFHQEFAMLVLSKNSLDKVNVDEWLGRIAQMKKDDPALWKSETVTLTIVDDKMKCV